MSYLTVETIPVRNWKKNMESWELVTIFDKNRKKPEFSVDQRIHYLWFHYLRLSMNLEELGYRVQKKGAGGKLVEETKVRVKKDIYKDWSLKSLYEMKFKTWYDVPKHNLLFSEGGFKPVARSRYHSLVKRFNVFIEYLNLMDSFEYKRGDMSKEMKISENIIQLYQKERFDILKKRDPRKDNKSQYNTLVLKDVKDCEKTILAVCEGRFPK